MTVGDLRAIVKRLNGMRARVEVGVPAGPREKDGMSVAAVAAINEFGAHVVPHSRIHGQTIWQNPRTGRFVGKGTKLKMVHEIKAKPATLAHGITIPARSFLRGGIEKALPSLISLNGANLAAIGRGQMTIKTALSLLGQAASAAVKREITEGNFQPNAPSTIRAKRSSRPLIASTQMRQSVTYDVVIKGGG